MPQSRVFTDADLRKKKTDALPEGLTPIPDGDYDHTGLTPLDENDKPYDTVDLRDHSKDHLHYDAQGRKYAVPVDAQGRAIARPTVDPNAQREDTDSLFSGHNIKTALLDPISDAPSRFGRYLSKKIDPQQGGSGLHSAASAGVEALGDEISGFTNPVNIGMTLATEGGSALAGTGNKAAIRAFEASGMPETDAAVDAIKQIKLFQAANAARNVGRALAVPGIYESGKDLADPNTPWQNKLNDIPGLLLGGLALRSSPYLNHTAENLARPIEGPEPLPNAEPAEPKQSNFFQTNENGDVVPGDLSPVRPVNPSGRSLDTEFAKPIKWKNQPIIQNAADNDPKQLGIFDEKPGWTGNAKQLDLGDAPPRQDLPPSQQGQLPLDLVGFNPRMPNEFLPDNSYLNKPNYTDPNSQFHRPEVNNELTNEFNKPLGTSNPPEDFQLENEQDSPKVKESKFSKPVEETKTEQSHPLLDVIKKEELDPHEADTPEITALKERLRQSLDRDKSNNDEDLFPKHMRATENPENVALGGTTERGLNILGTTLYSEDRPTIAAKELLQNAVDEHRISGTKAPIKFLFHYFDTIPGTKEPAQSITIGDRGRGVTKEQIYTVLTNMFESGKADEEGASGGFGIAKAAPTMGGKYARFVSVVNENGKKIRYTFEGTPAQLKNQKKGVPVKGELMPKDTPTGLKATVYYDKDTHLGYAKQKVEKMALHSMGNQSPIELAENYHRAGEGLGASDNINRDIENYFNDKPSEKYGIFHSGQDITKHTPLPAPELQDTLKLPGADVNIHYDTPDENSRAQVLETFYSNNGLHQFVDKQTLSQQGALKNVPSRIKFDIKPTVAEGEDGYPFTANREQLQKDTREAISDWVDKNIISGALEKQRQALKDMYNDMKPLNTHGTGTTNPRPVVLYDPNNELTPEQHKALANNPFVMDFADTMGDIIHNALDAGNEKWGERIEKTGITLDPTMHGVWIPNPENRGSATILINPFINIARHTPLEAARENIATAWHEAGHTGRYGETTSEIDWANVDGNDPEIGPYFQKYMNEVQHARRENDPGHQLDWLRHTAEVYAKAGTYGWNSSVGALHDIFTGGKPGSGYTPEVQDALRIYLDRERAAGAGKDILGGTGVKSDATTSGKKSLFSNAGSNGTRSATGQALSSAFDKPIKWEKPTKEVVNQVQKDIPQQEIPNRIANISKHADEALRKGVKKDEKENIIEKALNLQRTLLTSFDLSAPGRQGLPLIWHPSWWKSFGPMVQSWGSEKAYQNAMKSIVNDPSGLFKPDENGVSFANQAKLELTDALSHREEVFRSQIAERFVPGVAPSVRAYTAYMNKLRADTFKSMVKAAGAENNLVDATKIADFVNVATGRGSLGGFEGSAKTLSHIFFAPRLMGSRIQMYQRTLNPWFYAKVPPVVRQAQLKSALMLAGTGLVMGQLSKMAGAEVNTDPTNSDFGKIRFGKTRIDPFAGHQQYLVGAARLLTGQSTSSTTGKTTDMSDPKYGQTTRQDIVTRFMGSKLAPVPSFVWDWMAGTNFDGTPFDTKQAMEQRIVPIVMQDLHDIWKEDPALLPGALASASAFGGFGVQTYGR